VSELGGSIDEVKSNLLTSSDRGLRMKRLSQRDGSLLAPNSTSLEHKPVVVDNTIMRESSKRRDRLLGQINFGGRRFGITSLSNSVDFLVHLRSVMISVLTSTSNSDYSVCVCVCERVVVLTLSSIRKKKKRTGYSSGMPRTDTCNLSETTMSLSGKTSGSPSGGYTLVSFSFGYTDHVDHFVLGENAVASNLTLKKRLREGNLVINTSTVHLDLTDVSLSLSEVELGHLSMSDDANHGAILRHSLELRFNISSVALVLGSVLSESFLLGLVPVLVHSSSGLVADRRREYRGKSAQSAGRFHVTCNTDGNHGRCLDNRHSLHNLLLVKLRSDLGHSSLNVGHTRFESHERGQVRLRVGVVSRELLDLSSVMLGSLTRKKSQRSMTRCFEFTMTHVLLNSFVLRVIISQ